MPIVFCEEHHALADKADHGFALPDVRHDPLVGHMLARLWALMVRHALASARDCAVVALSRSGCHSHVAKVADGIAQDRARHAFFVRAGPQMMATYAAMALGAHGPTFTILHAGDGAVVRTALQGFVQMLPTAELVLLGGDSLDGRAHTFAALVSRDDAGHWPDLGLAPLSGWLDRPDSSSQRSVMHAV